MVRRPRGGSFRKETEASQHPAEALPSSAEGHPLRSEGSTAAFDAWEASPARGPCPERGAHEALRMKLDALDEIIKDRRAAKHILLSALWA